MTYAAAITYLYDRLPVFHRVGASAYKPGLGNVLALCRVLGNPQQNFRSIHVAGTNGKGSCSHLLASIYQAAGYRVGLFTSPHLKSFTERIRINGACISEVDVAAFVAQHQPLIEAVEPSFFEVTVAMAFDYFSREAVDLAIIEVGLGGRLDSTNIITPLLSVITSIGWDHMDLLGPTLPLIAAEKAGIIKPGVPVVVGESSPETLPVFVAMAVENEAPVYWADERWMVDDLGITAGVRQVRCRSLPVGDQDFCVELPLLGLYQLVNLRTVLTAVAILNPLFPITDAAIAVGCAQVMTATGLKGRFQQMGVCPYLFADTAHNEPGLAAVLATVQTFPYRTLRLVLGFVRDKVVADLLLLFPPDAVYYYAQAASSRAVPVTELVVLGNSLGRIGIGYATVNDAVVAAGKESDLDDFILITGSTYLVGELLDL